MRDILKRLGIMLFAAIALAIPAAAQTEFCSRDIDTANPSSLRDCVRLLLGRVETLEESRKGLRESAERAWKIVGNDGALVSELPKHEPMLFAPDDLVSSLWQWRRALGEIGLFDPSTIIRALDARFAADGGQGLRTFYKKHQALIVAAFRDKILPQLGPGLAEYRVLLAKPFNPLIGHAAYAWYEENCKLGASCSNRVFADSFAAHYGRPPTREDAYLLRSLYTRYQNGGENGQQYVDAIREIGLAILAATEVTRTGAGN